MQLASDVQSQVSPHLQSALAMQSWLAPMVSGAEPQAHAHCGLVQVQDEGQVQSWALRWSVIGTSWVSGFR